MYTFHLEAVVADAATAKHPDQEMVKVLKQVKEAGMHAGVALKPKTPVETLYPYIEDKLIDQVRSNSINATALQTAFSDSNSRAELYLQSLVCKLARIRTLQKGARVCGLQQLHQV